MSCDWPVQRLKGPMPDVAPVLTPATKVRFQYPITNPTLDFQSRVPEFNNTITGNINLGILQSRGNYQDFTRQSYWSKIQTIVVTFMYLDSTEINNFKLLLKQSLGKLIKYTDYESVEWSALIINPNSPASQERIMCGNSIQLQMEVTKI